MTTDLWHVIGPLDSPSKHRGLALCDQAPSAAFAMTHGPEVWRSRLADGGVCERCLRQAQRLLLEAARPDHWWEVMKLAEAVRVIDRALWPAEAARMAKAAGEETPTCTDRAYLAALRSQGWRVRTELSAW